MWPHLFGASFTARSADTLRRNAVVMPLYSISLAFIFFIGFAAVLVVPALSDGDLSLLTVVRKAFPAWMLGLIGGAGALTAMVPAAILVLTASTLFAKNLYRPIFAPAMTDDHVARLARIMVVALSLISLYFAVYSSTTLVALLLLGYAGVAQFFPGVVLGLFWKRVTMVGVFGGMMVGVACTTFLVLSKKDPFGGLNAGFIALCANFATTVLVSMLAPVKAGGRERLFSECVPQPLGRISHHGSGRAGLRRLRKNSPGQALSATTACASAAALSAAACCRFPPRELARGDCNREHHCPPASWLEPKRQQAAALQSSLRMTAEASFSAACKARTFQWLPKSFQTW